MYSSVSTRPTNRKKKKGMNNTYALILVCFFFNCPLSWNGIHEISTHTRREIYLAEHVLKSLHYVHLRGKGQKNRKLIFSI